MTCLGDWDPLLGQGARERQDPVLSEKDVPGGGTVQEDGAGQGRRQRLIGLLLRRRRGGGVRGWRNYSDSKLPRPLPGRRG